MPPTGGIHPKSEYILGVDLARLGADSSVFIVVERPFGDDKLYVVYVQETRRKLLTDSMMRIQELDRLFNFNKIICDCTGLGAAVVDVLKQKVGYKVEGFLFTMQKKQQLYGNLYLLLQQRKLKIPNHQKLIYQLLDVRYEMANDEKNVKIHHSERGFDDFCFVKGTHILTDKGQIPIEKIKIGDKVMTRKGYKKVLSIGNRYAKTISRFGLTGTPDHPFITSKGIVKFISLKASDKIYKWNEKLSSIEERNITDIQVQKEGISESIIGHIRAIYQNHYIDKSGKIPMGRFRKDMSFITKMETLLIMLLKISKSCLEGNINQNMHKQNKEKKKQELILQNMRDLGQYYGINLKKGDNGIGNTHSNKVLERKRVYNLKIKDCPEYFANNILVHNCDALALGCWGFKEDNRVSYRIF